MTRLCVSSYPDSIMDRSGPQFLSRDDESASDLSSVGSTYYPGLSGAAFPPLRAPSDTHFLTTESGVQTFQVPAVQPRTQNGFSNSYSSFAISPVSQAGPHLGRGSQMFDMPYVGPNNVDQWMSAMDLPMGSPPIGTMGSEYDGLAAVDMSYSLSGTTLLSGPSQELDLSSPSDTTVCKNSPEHEKDYLAYGKYDNGNTGGQTFHRSQRNGNRHPDHTLSMSTDSSLNILGHSGEETLFSSQVDIQSQSFYQSNIPVGNGSQMGNPSYPGLNWDVEQESRVPSPELNGVWVSPFIDSPPESHQDFSLHGVGLSTQYSRVHGKAIDQTLNRIPGNFDEYVPFTSSGFAGDEMYPDENYPGEESQSRHSSTDADNNGTAREHALYQKAPTGPDGLYHCPWEKDASCAHKPDKLKCNYDKFVDSHLKPYRCKVHSCENARFSSTACLLRHEREAHAMHGHGEKPFLCSFSGCERGLPGHGFPRHWNLRDHMRRVHDTAPSPSSNNKPAKVARKRKNESSVEGNSSKRNPASVSEPPQEVRLSLKEQLQFRRKQIEEQLSQLDDADPNDPTTRAKIRNAENTFKEMQHIVHAIPKVSRRTSHISG